MNYTSEERAFIWLSAFEVPYKREEALINLGLTSLFEHFDDGRAERILDSELYNKMMKDWNNNFLNSYISALDRSGIVCVTIESDGYPKKLKEIDNPPYVLFTKGNLSLLNDRAVGIVGTRTPTNYGRIVTEKFAGELAAAGLVIVSGLAYGVDAISHSSALKAKGKTIAVLGGGFNHIYPHMNTALMEEISRNGLVISEYKPSMKPTKFTFPHRNRIIAALSDGVLITEAAENSGSLHTKNYALEYNREVFIVPGNINSTKSRGTNNIIRSMQGCCVLDSADILERFGIKPPASARREPLQLSINEEIVINLLKEGEVGLDKLTQNCGLNINNLNSCLTTLEIRNIIQKLPGNTYILRK